MHNYYDDPHPRADVFPDVSPRCQTLFGSIFYVILVLSYNVLRIFVL
jgi:hypothetical protein